MDTSEIGHDGDTLEVELLLMNSKLRTLTEAFEVQADMIAQLKAEIAQVNKNNQQLSQVVCLVSEGKRFMMDSPTEMKEINQNPLL